MAERGVVRTFLFSDLREFTVFVETHGDEATAKLIERYRRIVRAEIANHAGAEIKTEGDSFYVVFATPGDAVRAALGIVRRVRLNNERHPNAPISVGIGINTGEAVAHDDGFIGSAVILASRLQGQAKAGQILVTEAVRAMVRTAAIAPMRELGAWRLKGITEPVRVYEVESAKLARSAREIGPNLRLPSMLEATDAPGLVMCPELVQRDTELAALLEHVGAASTGELRFVAITGEAGVGKSRLVREAARVAHADGVTVLGGRCHANVAQPYEPIIAALRPYAHARGVDILRRLLGPLTLELRRLLPELDVATGDGEVPEDERRDRFVRTVQLLLEDASSQRPVLLVLEDFHEADSATVELVRTLAGGLRAGICIAIAMRDDAAGGAAARALLAELERERRLARIALGPLDLAGVTRMTAKLLPARNVPVLARAIFERSDGIPFYVEELAKSVFDVRDTASIERALPNTVRDSVASRVAHLVAERGDGVRELVECAAVAGIPLGHEALVRLAARDEREVTGDLAAAVSAQLLERMATRNEIYQVRHALTRDSLLDGIPPARRRALHLRVAETFEALGVGAPTLALHFAAGGDRVKAMRYSRDGAANALDLAAYGFAIDLLRTAAETARGTVDEGDLTLRLGIALRVAGRVSEAKAALTRARELATDPEERARIDLQLAAVLRMEGLRDEARAAARRAAAAAGEGGGPLLAEALVRQADLSWAEGDAQETARLAYEALLAARRVDIASVEIEALTLLGAAKTRLGAEDGLTYLVNAVGIAQSRGRAPDAVTAYFELARGLLFVGRNDDGLAALRSALGLAREHGLEFAQARILAQATTMGVNLGKYEEARGFAEQAVALARPDTVAASYAGMTLAHVMSDQGDYASALAIYERIEPDVEHGDPERRHLYWSYRSQALSALGRRDDAAAAAKKAVQVTLARAGQGMTAFLCAAEVAEAQRDVEAIHALAPQFEEYFKGRDTAPIRLCRLEIAAITALCERRPDAADRFDAVADAYFGLSARVRLAYRRSVAAALRLGDPARRAEAREKLADRRRELESYGAVRYLSIIDGLLARRTSGRAPHIAILGQRELRVATLLSRGLTDRAIAAELRIPLAQASELVDTVRERLGVSTRSQVVAWMANHEPERVGGPAR